MTSVDLVFEMLVTDNPSTDQIFQRSELKISPNIQNKDIPPHSTYFRPYSLLNTFSDKLTKQLNQSVDNHDVGIDHPKKVYRAD